MLLPQERPPPVGADPSAVVPPKVDVAPPGPALAGGRGLRALITRWGPDVFLGRSLLASAWLAASFYCALLAVRARVAGDSPWPVLGSGALLLVALTLPHVSHAPVRPIACALLAGVALAALTVLSRPYDPLVFGLYSLALVLAALVLNGRDTAAITAYYFVYYVLYNVLIADPSSASLHWESAAATLLVFAGITLAVWSLVAGQRWLRASRQVVEEANTKLEASLAREQRFVGDAAHQLRTPLAILRASIDLLGTQRDQSPAAVQQTLREVSRESDRLGHIVDDLLALTRADAGMSIAREPVDLLGLVDEVYHLSHRLPDGDRLRLDLGDRPERWDWVVEGDERLLQQLLINLVDNALKYSAADEPVTLALGATAANLSVSVTDYGAGIPVAELERIFERFYRTPQARAGGVTGSGLGLCLARWIAEAHGGRLEVESVVGHGTTFRLCLQPIPPTTA